MCLHRASRHFRQDNYKQPATNQISPRMTGDMQPSASQDRRVPLSPVPPPSPLSRGAEESYIRCCSTVRLCCSCDVSAKKKCPLLPQGGNKYITRCFITVTVVSSSSKYLSHLFLVSPPLIYFTDPNGFNSTHTGGHDDMLIDSLTNMQTHTRLWMLLQRIHNDLMWWLSAVSHRAESLPRLIKINVADARNGLRHKKKQKKQKKNQPRVRQTLPAIKHFLTTP